MVHDDGPVGLDGVQVQFDDERVVSDAGIALAAMFRSLTQLASLRPPLRTRLNTLNATRART